MTLWTRLPLSSSDSLPAFASASGRCCQKTMVSPGRSLMMWYGPTIAPLTDRVTDSSATTHAEARFRKVTDTNRGVNGR